MYQPVTANYSTKGNPSLLGYKGALMFMDTERENQINLGNDWPFDELAEGECLVSNAFEKTYGVKKGETIYLNYTIKYSLKNIRNFYNVLATENGW